MAQLKNCGVTVTVVKSEADGIPVIEIDTDPEEGDTPLIRVYVNDGSVFEGVPYPEA